MNSIELEKLIGHLASSKKLLSPNKKFLDITWKLEEATSSHLVFCQGSSKAIDDLSQIGLLIFDQDFPERPEESWVITGDHFFQAQKIILDIFYPLNENLKIVGITGTNGKTTTVDFCHQLANQLGHKAACIGTLGVYSQDKKIFESMFTTPPFIELRKYLYHLQKEYEVVFMEVSSHGLQQKRTYGLTFDQAAWMSFSQDHLDYHQNMESYFNSKCLIFNQLKSSAKVIIPPAEEILFEKLKLRYPSQVEKNNINITNIILEIPLFCKTSFNLANLNMAIKINSCLWGNIKEFDLNKLSPTPGRFSVKKYGNRIVIVDYAHTPDALEKICKEIKNIFKNYNLIIVFGCGGDRDQTKRPIMGAIANQYGDKIYITSDNPRNENPQKIIEQICQGIIGKTFTVQVDRKMAIQEAIAHQTENDILLIAGKGHENYQLINGIKYEFDDHKVAQVFYEEHL